MTVSSYSLNGCWTHNRLNLNFICGHSLFRISVDLKIYCKIWRLTLFQLFKQKKNIFWILNFASPPEKSNALFLWIAAKRKVRILCYTISKVRCNLGLCFDDWHSLTTDTIFTNIFKWLIYCVGLFCNVCKVVWRSYWKVCMPVVGEQRMLQFLAREAVKAFSYNTRVYGNIDAWRL